MAFDPSVISQIPTYAGNPMQAVGEGVQLANAENTYQAGALDLSNQRQAQADEQQARQAFKGVDPSNLDQMTKAASKVESPAMRMKLMGQLQQQQQQKKDLTIQDLQIASEQSDALAGALDPIVAQLDQLSQQRGMTPAMLDAKAKQLVIPAALQLRQQRPDLAQYVDRALQDPQMLTYQGIRSIDQQSKRGSQAIKDRLAQQHQSEVERENRERDSLAERKEGLAERKQTQSQKEAEEGVISDDSAQLAVDRILNGEQARDVLANFGRGKQGPANIAKVQNLLAKTSKDRGISSQDISARMVEMKGLAKEEQTEASIAGKISYAEKEIQQIGPKVLEISAKVPRGAFVPWNKLRNYTASQLSDPNLKQLKAYLNTLTNSYDVLGGRGGTDVEKRAHNRELLDAADSPEALKAAVDAITQEAALSHEAARESMTVDRSRLGGGTTPAPGATPAAGGGLPAGWSVQAH